MDPEHQEGGQNADDIECIEWLREVDFEQYEETFLANFSVGGALLSRKRLAQIRLQDFPKMNILNFEHQKILLTHIKHTLQFTFHSPIRKREVRQLLGKEEDVTNKALFPPNGSPHITGMNRASSSRRRSFDQNAWDNINKLRSTDIGHKVAADHLRAIHAGHVDHISSKKDKKINRRRFSYDPDAGLKAKLAVSAAKASDEMKRVFDIIRQEMAELNIEVLGHFKKLVRCEQVSLHFINEQQRHLLCNFNGLWYKHDMEHGIPAMCATNGETINVGNCYTDSRFNKGFDRKTGFDSKTCMCQPVINMDGGIVGVVCFLNKLGGNDAVFDKSDEGQMQKCAASVAEELSDRFAELNQVGECMYQSALLVSSDVSDNHLKGFAYRKGQSSDATSASAQYVSDTRNQMAASRGAQHDQAFHFNESPDERMSMRMKTMRREQYSDTVEMPN